MKAETATKALNASILFSTEICNALDRSELAKIFRHSSDITALRQAIVDMQAFVDEIEGTQP